MMAFVAPRHVSSSEQHVLDCKNLPKDLRQWRYKLHKRIPGRGAQDIRSLQRHGLVEESGAGKAAGNMEGSLQ